MPGSEHRRVSCVVPTPERPLFEQGVCAACNTLWPCEVARLTALLAAAEAALLEILRAACWEWRLTEWRKHSVTAVGTQPTPQEACREIREIARLALHDIGAEAEQ